MLLIMETMVMIMTTKMMEIVNMASLWQMRHLNQAYGRLIFPHLKRWYGFVGNHP